MSNDNEVLLDKGKQNDSKMKVERKEGEPTPAFKGASWAALIVGVTAYLIGLYNATMQLFWVLLVCSDVKTLLLEWTSSMTA